VLLLETLLEPRTSLRVFRKKLNRRKLSLRVEKSFSSLRSLSSLTSRDCYPSKTRKMLKPIKVSLTSRKRLLIT
jgi:hypothetical protein